MALTATDVKAFHYDPTKGKKQILWDDDPAGFGVRAYPNGKKSYVVMYRVGRGRGARQRLVVLDSTERIKLQEARNRAKDAQARGRQGEDPFAHLYHEDNRPTVKELAERYMKEHAPRLAERSQKNDRYTWDRYILPRIGRKVVAQLERGDVHRMMTSIGAEAPVSANRALALLSKALNLAELWGWRPHGTNPCRGQERFQEGRRSRVLTAEELSRLNAALDRSSAVVAALIRLYMYTGARPGELPPLRWEPDPAGREPHVDLAQRVIFHPAPKTRRKTGARTIYLSEQALAVLRGLGRSLENPYVFVGDKPGTHIVWVNKSLRGACERAGIRPCSPYDLRHTYLTWLASGASVVAAQGQGGHALLTTTSRYVHPTEAIVRPGVEQVGEKLEQAMEVVH